MSVRLRSRPWLESLEDRCCPAVLGSVSRGVLTLVGDPDGTLAITQTAQGTFTVEDDDGAIAGSPFNNVKNLRVLLRGDDDTVTVDLGGLTLAGDATFRLDGGDDSLTVSNGTVGGNLTVADTETVSLAEDATVAGSATVLGSRASNDVTVDGDVGGSLIFVAPLFTGNQEGASSLTLGATASVGDNLSFTSSLLNNANGSNLAIADGATIGGNLLFVGTGQTDTVDIAGDVGGSVLVLTLGGDDTVSVAETSEIGGLAAFELGSGDDTLSFAGDAGALVVLAGSGNDDVTLAGTASVEGRTFIDLGPGDDSLTVEDGFMTGTFLALGGRGTDTLVNDAGLDDNLFIGFEA